MNRRAIMKFRPGIERFEEKWLMSAGASAAQHANLRAVAEAAALARRRPPPEFTLSRITNPTPFNAKLTPPFAQVLVQAPQPVVGGVYNLLFISVRNETFQTFTASSGLTANFSGGLPVSILTGSEQWKPNQVMVFYVITKKYYPPNPVVSAGFRFNFAGGTGIPGPSGIFLRVKYNPATIANIINYAVAFGPGSRGHELGLPDTSIYEFTNARTEMEPL